MYLKNGLSVQKYHVVPPLEHMHTEMSIHWTLLSNVFFYNALKFCII